MDLDRHGDTDASLSRVKHCFYSTLLKNEHHSFMQRPFHLSIGEVKPVVDG